MSATCIPEKGFNFLPSTPETRSSAALCRGGVILIEGNVVVATKGGEIWRLITHIWLIIDRIALR